MRIHIECRRPQESDQGLAAFARKIHRQRRGCRDRGDDRNTGGERFLHDFERGAAADHQDVMTEREEAVEKGASDRFIDPVVAANIFADNEWLAK